MMTTMTMTTKVDAFSSPQRVFVSTPTTGNPRLVSDCMTSNPVTLKTTDTVDEAIAILLSAGFNGAPVVDPETSNLVGVVSAFDFLQKAETGAVLPFTSTGNEEEWNHMVHMARKIVATTVGDLMAPVAITVTPNMTIREAADLMLRDRIHRLCVVDKSNNLVGVLSTADVMKNVITALRALPSEATSAVGARGVGGGGPVAASEGQPNGLTP
jgi:CBS domain-containing protein